MSVTIAWPADRRDHLSFDVRSHEGQQRCGRRPTTAGRGEPCASAITTSGGLANLACPYGLAMIWGLPGFRRPDRLASGIITRGGVILYGRV